MNAKIEETRMLKLSTQPGFEERLATYRNGNFAVAKTRFEKVLTVNP